MKTKTQEKIEELREKKINIKEFIESGYNILLHHNILNSFVFAENNVENFIQEVQKIYKEENKCSICDKQFDKGEYKCCGNCSAEYYQ